MDAAAPRLAQYALGAGGPLTPWTTDGMAVQITPLERFTVPLGGQEIELQDLVHDAGGMHLLRIRIRERARFTIFDVDPASALRWARAMERWAAAQAPAGGPGT